MKTPQTYGAPPKSTPRKATKHPWIRYEALMKRYLPLVGGTVWATYTTLFTYRNRRSNQCFPRYQTLADARGVSRRTAIRHVKTLIAFGLIEKAYRFYDDDNKRERGGQRSNRYWFTSFSPQDVTPGMSGMPPRTRSSPNQIDIKNLAENKPTPQATCEHPWGNPLGYPHEGFWRCTACGDPYKR